MSGDTEHSATPVDGPTPDLVDDLIKIANNNSDLWVEERTTIRKTADALTAARTEAERAREEMKLDNDAWQRDADRLRVAESALVEAREENEQTADGDSEGA